jgi:hypothetical protein
MKTYEEIQKELDKHRVDEWHSVIPLSEDGAVLLEDLEEESYPNRLSGTNGLFLHENEQSLIKPKEAYTTEAHGLMLEDNDYIYNIFIVSGGCDHHEGHLAQITRHDKQKHIVTREEWENSYTCG